MGIAEFGGEEVVAAKEEVKVDLERSATKRDRSDRRRLKT